MPQHQKLTPPITLTSRKKRRSDYVIDFKGLKLSAALEIRDQWSILLTGVKGVLVAFFHVAYIKHKLKQRLTEG